LTCLGGVTKYFLSWCLKFIVSPILALVVSRGGCLDGFTRSLCSEKAANGSKIGRWSNQWRQDRTMIQPIKAKSDDDPANEGKIDRWFGQSKWDRSMIQTTKAIILNARIAHHLLAMSYSIIKLSTAFLINSRSMSAAFSIILWRNFSKFLDFVAYISAFQIVPQKIAMINQVNVMAIQSLLFFQFIG